MCTFTTRTSSITFKVAKYFEYFQLSDVISFRVTSSQKEIQKVEHLIFQILILLIRYFRRNCANWISRAYKEWSVQKTSDEKWLNCSLRLTLTTHHNSIQFLFPQTAWKMNIKWRRYVSDKLLFHISTQIVKTGFCKILSANVLTLTDFFTKILNLILPSKKTRSQISKSSGKIQFHERSVSMLFDWLAWIDWNSTVPP